MTVTNETLMTTAIGDGVTTRYYFTFNIFDDEDLLVTVTSPEESKTTLILDSDYTVNRALKYINLTSGSLCPDGYTLTMEANIPFTQETEFTDGGSFHASVFNNALDKLTMLIIQIKRRMSSLLDFTVTTTVGTPGSDKVIPTEKAVRTALAESGVGNVNGPEVSMNNAVARFDGSSGAVIQNSQVIIDDDGNISIPATADVLVGTDTYIKKSTLKSQTIMYATEDNTPSALSVDTSTIVGRNSTGSITALTPQEVRTMINVADGATANTKATYADVQTGTDDEKYITAKALKDSAYVPVVAPSSAGYVLTANGSAWVAVEFPSFNATPSSLTVVGNIPHYGMMVASAPSERSNTTTTYSKKKEFTINISGTYNLYWEHKNANAGATVYSKVTINGTQYGSEYSRTSTSYGGINVSLTLTKNDVVAIWIKAGSDGTTAQIKYANLQINESAYASINTD